MGVQGIASGASRLSALLLAAGLLGGCEAIDGFSPRAKVYNAETGDSRAGSVLANILRAAYVEPLQFTDITTMTGSASIDGKLGASLPFDPVPRDTSRMSTLSPEVSANGTSTFNVANLNTQEFYYGLQTPLSEQLIGTYLSTGFSPDILFALVISEIEVTSGDRRTILRNSARTRDSFAAFYSAVQWLLDEGLTVERISDKTAVSPPLTAAEARNSRLLSALVAAPDGAPVLAETKAGSGRYQLIKSGAQFRFCFDAARRVQKPAFDDVDLLSGPKALPGKQVHLAEAFRTAYPPLTFTLEAGDFCGADQKAREAAPVARPGMVGRTFKINTRSVFGIFQFLGEYTRTQLGLTTGVPEPMTVAHEKSGPFTLLRILPGRTAQSGITTVYRGTQYSIPLDPSGKLDHSGRVVQLLADLIALQSSAKTLPAPNLITVVGR